MSNLKHYKMFINGEWVESESKKTFETLNPENNKPWAVVPEASTKDVDKAVKELKAGKIELRVEKNGIIHTRCGKSSFDENALVENIRSIYDTVIKARPASVKGTYLKKISVSSTMGPGIKIDQGSIN